VEVLQAILLIVATIAIAAIAWAAVTLAQGILREVRKISQATEDVSRLLRTAEEELVPAIRDTRTAIGDVDQLIVCATATIHRVDRLTGGVEGLLEGSVAGLAASKTVRSASATLLSVYEGVRQGIRVLRGSPDETHQGGTNDE
jgi:uncharacterized protein YoxC